MSWRIRRIVNAEGHWRLVWAQMGYTRSGPSPRVRRSWTVRRRLVLITLAALVALVLLAPLWLGYFGPKTAAYVTTWRPWRSHLTLRSERTFGQQWPQRATMEAEYRDPRPGPHAGLAARLPDAEAPQSMAAVGGD